MGKHNAPAPAPDYAGIMAAQAAQAQSQQQANIAQQQLDWAKQTYAQDQKQVQPLIDRMTRGMDQQYDYAQQQKDFWDQNYKPLEQSFAAKAQHWDTPERREQRAGEVGAEVAQQFKGAQDAAAQQLRDFGVDPSSPRYAATSLLGKLGQAGATAGSQNMARHAVEQEGLQLQQGAINVGRGYPGAINQSYGGAQNSANSAVGGINATSANGSAMMGTPTQWSGLSNQALGQWGNQASNNYNNYLQGFQFANTPMSSGIGSALGLIGGSILGNSKFMGALADGGSVPVAASPSMGANTDDIPARLNAGEFVMPKEAVSWFGEKAMHDMIIKAQKERAQTEQQSGAVPDVMPARAEAPRLISGQKPVAALPAR